MKSIVGFIVMLIMAAQPTVAQKIDNERMDRDIEIAENALTTMIRLQFQRNRYYGMDIKGNYTPGYGVTLRIPGEHNFIGAVGWDMSGGPSVLAAPAPPGVSYEYKTGTAGDVAVIRQGSNSDGNSASVVVIDGRPDKTPSDRSGKERTAKERSGKDAARQDSAREVYYEKVIKASKDFLADYGDVLSQLAPEEKILITNRGEGNRYMYWDKSSSNSRTMVTIEATKGDITAFKQGKINRDQLLGKMKVVNTQSTNEVNTDLELLSSIMNRLYRSDLAKTYYIDEGIYYERLKEFGAIFYMNVVSSIEQDVQSGEGRKFRMPTQKLQDLSQAERDKKVTELYPAFEKDIRESILEYGRTLKTLGPQEMLIFNVRLTKCEECGIPSTIELSVKNSVLKDYSEGKITHDAAAAQLNIKKGPAQ
jgi:hypothetical protein